jgi:PAT family beta-lactamase induction signal transducer AmpG
VLISPPVRARLLAPLLGFASGLPLFLTGFVLVTWMAREGVGLKTAAGFAAVGLPYTFKWVWAPLFDLVGRRRTWIVVLELALAAAIVGLAFAGAHAEVEVIALVAVAVAFLSASHDIVVDAFLAESFTPDERAAGAAAYVFGYRAAMVAVSGGGLWLVPYVGWQAVYLTVAALVPVGVIAVALLPEPVVTRVRAPAVREISAAVWELIARPGVIPVIMAVVMFRFGETMVTHMQGMFMVVVLGMDIKTFGAVATIAGFAGLAAGSVLLAWSAPRLGPRNALYVFGALAGAANLGWALLALTGPIVPVFVVVAFVDALGTALATGAFVAFLMGQCTPGRSATQYALLNALSSVGGRVFGFAIAPLVYYYGWAGFYVATALMIVPALGAFAMVPDQRFSRETT